MIPGINPKQMKAAMKQMGIAQVDVDATRVIIELEDKKLVFNNPSLAKVKAMGQETWQLSGNYVEEPINSSEDEVIEITQEDLDTIMSQTNCTEEEAMKALEDTEGDLAEAIIKISEHS